MKRLTVQPADPLLTPGEAALLLHIRPSTLGSYRRAGRIKAVRLPSGRHHYRTSVVMAFRDQPSKTPPVGSPAVRTI